MEWRLDGFGKPQHQYGVQPFLCFISIWKMSFFIFLQRILPARNGIIFTEHCSLDPKYFFSGFVCLCFSLKHLNIFLNEALFLMHMSVFQWWFKYSIWNDAFASKCFFRSEFLFGLSKKLFFVTIDCHFFSVRLFCFFEMADYVIINDTIFSCSRNPLCLCTNGIDVFTPHSLIHSFGSILGVQSFDVSIRYRCFHS